MKHPIHALAVALAAAAIGAAAAHAAAPRPDGITVHGWWTLTVRDHGRVVAKRQFENALTPTTGAETLAAIFMRQEVPWTWAITVQDTPGHKGICAAGHACLIAEPSVAGADSQNLVVESVANGGGKLRLRGSIEAAVDGQITNVATSMGVCSPDKSFCRPPDTSSDFTNKRLASALQLQAGQQLSVSVVLSFS